MEPTPSDSAGSVQLTDAANAPMTWEQVLTLLDEREDAYRRDVQELRAQLAAFQDSQQSDHGEASGNEADLATVGRN